MTPSADRDSEPAQAVEARQLAVRAPAPAIHQNVRSGTAGWTDPTLIKSRRFYPSGVHRSADRLGYYASQFSMVEVDATYYSLLPPAVAARWASATPETFHFDVKAHPVLSGHPIDIGRLPSDLRELVQRAGHERRVYARDLSAELVHEMECRFRQLVEVLRDAKKLGCVMVQFPPWFRATRGNGRRIERLAERLPDLPLAVEFRHPSWFEAERRDRLFSLLRSHRLSFICVDEPNVVGGGVPPTTWVTNPELAVVRFHGRNAAAWSRRGATVQERFDYLYAPEELRAWVEPVRRLSGEAREVHAVFNNCVHDYAVVGAKGLCVLLGERE